LSVSIEKPILIASPGPLRGRAPFVGPPLAPAFAPVLAFPPPPLTHPPAATAAASVRNVNHTLRCRISLAP
jgi:hypothetical protein